MFNEIFKAIKEMFCMPDAVAVATAELAKAKRDLLRSLGELEVANAHVACYQARVERLTAYLAKPVRAGSKSAVIGLVRAKK